jgi:homoserine dehydrogenase
MIRFFSVTSVLLAVAGSANAASLTDSETTLICAVVDLASCVPGEGCTRETSDSINAPQLLTVDRKGHLITAHRPDGQLLSTNIDRVTQEQSLLVLDGVQNALSWTTTIADDSGHMTLSAIGDGEAYTAFGSCELK